MLLLKASQVKQLCVVVPQTAGPYVEIWFQCDSPGKCSILHYSGLHMGREARLSFWMYPAFIKPCFQGRTKEDLPLVSKRRSLSHLPPTPDLR